MTNFNRELFINAREMYEKTCMKTPFSRWIRDRIQKLNLREDVNFFVEHDISLYSHRKIKNYFLTIDTAILIIAHMRDEERRNTATSFLRLTAHPQAKAFHALKLIAQGKSNLLSQEYIESIF